jgi:hypothetical protein
MAFSPRPLWRVGAAVVLMLMSGCTAVPSGRPARHFRTPAVAAAYIPLQHALYLLWRGEGAATVIAPGIAATAGHNANLIPARRVIGRSRRFDLMYFRTSRRQVPPIGEPRFGEAVIAYGQGLSRTDLRQARGLVRYTQAPVLPRCKGCPVQQAFVYAAEGGRGFSGGPVVAAASGKVVGITFGFRNGLDDRHPKARLMYAYSMQRVLRELARVQARRAKQQRSAFSGTLSLALPPGKMLDHGSENAPGRPQP